MSLPIKKRRFPLIHSYPPKEISSLPSLDDNTVKVGEPCVSDGPTSSAITTSELSEKKEISFSDECEQKSDLRNADMAQRNIGLSRVMFQKDDACSNGCVENKETDVVNEKHALHLLEKPELKLPPTDPHSNPGLCAGKKGDEIDRNELDKCKSLPSLVKKEAELSVRLNEHLVTDSVPEGSDWKCQKENNLEPALLNFSLSKQGSYTQCPTGSVRSDYDGSLQQSNRENWDLNTSMELWEGCASDDSVLQVSVVQPNTIVTTHGCSTEMVRTDIPSGKLTALDHDGNLHLSLSSFDLRSVTSREQSSSDGALVKHELDDQCNLETPNASDICSSMNIIKAKSIKSESVYESKHEAQKTLGGRLNLVAKQDLPEVDNSRPIAMPVVVEMLEAARIPSCSTDLIMDENMSNHSELLTSTEGHLNWEVHQGGYGCGGGLVNSEMTDISKDPSSKDSSSSVIKPFIAEHENQNNLQWCPLKFTNEQCSGFQGGEECSVSDDEKISISVNILEDDPYSSEYESDGKHDVAEAMDVVDNDIEEDYEDGEVREPILNTQVESSVCEKREVENFGHGDCSNDKKINSVGLLPGIECSSLVSVKQENESESHDVKREDNFPSQKVTTNQSSEQEKSDAFCLKELHVEENTAREFLNKANEAIKATGTRQLFQCEKIDALEDQEIYSEKATDGLEEPVVTVFQGDAENVKTVDFVQNDGPALPNIKEPLNNDDVIDDLTRGSKDSQIVNPCQASASSSPSKTRTNLVRSVLTRTDRELIPDVAHEEEKLQPQGRGDLYSDVSQKIYVNRHQNLSPQTNFTRRRGRFTIRLNSVQGEWDFNPTISPGIYSDQIPYDAPRRKYMPAVFDDDIDPNHYEIKPDGPFRNAGHRGRQILNDEGSLFCHMPSRRKSPGRRDGPPVRGVKMVHRIPRNISSSRCIREAGGSELVGPRHGEKFMRTLEDETMDSIYARPEPRFEVDRPPFIQERRSFSIQRKSFSRIDSKSPGRSRGRSPGQWFPSKRKPDRFCGHPEMTRRSLPSYRVDSMRSPPDQPPPIHGDMPVRRHGFPFSPLPPNDLRDMGASRDHGPMRSGIRSKNRSDRMPFRNRRFEVMDPRDRIDSNEYFDGPVHPAQLNELGGDGNDEDRRRFADRNEHLHSFRPQYNDSDGENYHNNADDSRRYCAEDEPEFHERGKLREREFDRRVKNQRGNLPRRIGVMEEHEVEDYRHGRQLWNDHDFEDDMSRMKRKRF